MAKPTEQQRRVKELRNQNKSTAEIAKALGITVGGVRMIEAYKRRFGKPGRPPKKAVA